MSGCATGWSESAIGFAAGRLGMAIFASEGHQPSRATSGCNEHLTVLELSETSSSRSWQLASGGCRERTIWRTLSFVVRS
jgi:hypothetical protein